MGIFWSSWNCHARVVAATRVLAGSPHSNVTLLPFWDSINEHVAAVWSRCSTTLPPGVFHHTVSLAGVTDSKPETNNGMIKNRPRQSNGWAGHPIGDAAPVNRSWDMWPN